MKTLIVFRNIVETGMDPRLGLFNYRCHDTFCTMGLFKAGIHLKAVFWLGVMV